MDEKNENKHLTVIIPLEYYNLLIRDSERYHALANAIMRGLTPLTPDNYDTLMVDGSVADVFKAVCPEEYGAWLRNMGFSGNMSYSGNIGKCGAEGE